MLRPMPKGNRSKNMTAERHVRLFRNGRNQALRIPREFAREPGLKVTNWLV